MLKEEIILFLLNPPREDLYQNKLLEFSKED